MNNKLLTTTLIGLPLMVSSALAVPTHRNMSHQSNHRPAAHMAAPNLVRFEKKVGRVGLNKKQHKQMDQIIQHSQYLMRGNFKQMKNFETRLNTLALSPSYNQQQVRKMAMNHADIIANMLVIQADTKQQVFKILTPAQRQKLLTAKTSGKKRRGRRS